MQLVVFCLLLSGIALVSARVDYRRGFCHKVLMVCRDEKNRKVCPALLEKIQKKCHRIICGLHCLCESFPLLSTRRRKMALHTFLQLRHPQHMLHDLYPPFLPHGKRLQLAHNKTNRRLNYFIPYCAHIFNDL